MNIKIGAKIKELRKRNDVTQEQLAEFLGVTSQAISKWESENGYPDIEFISLIADFFNVTTDYLLNHSQQKQGHSKILIVDDANMRDTFCAVLQPEYELIFTELGRNVLKYAVSEQPDLILMDIITSGIQHFDDLEALKDSEITRSIPVIIVSASYSYDGTPKDGFENNIEDCIRMGAEDYIVKPFSPNLLRARIAAQLRKPTQNTN